MGASDLTCDWDLDLVLTMILARNTEGLKRGKQAKHSVIVTVSCSGVITDGGTANICDLEVGHNCQFDRLAV